MEVLLNKPYSAALLILSKIYLLIKRTRWRFLLIKQEIPRFLFNKQSLQVNWTGLKNKKDRHFCLISLFQKHSNSPETIWLLFKFFVPCNSMSIWPHSQNSIITFAWQLTIFTYNTWIIIDETRKGSSHCSWGPNAEARMYPKCKTNGRVWVPDRTLKQ